jgi:hypothetical protein
MNKQIKTENDFIESLANLNIADTTQFSLLDPEDKELLDSTEKNILEFLDNNKDFDNYTEDHKNELFDTAIDMWNQLKDIIKNAKCSYKCTNLELKVIDKKLHQSIDYTAETIFYGLHLKKNFLDALPKNTNKDEFAQNDITVTFSHAVALHHLFSYITVKGLNKENYAFANILYYLTEVSKVYEHYNNMSARLNKAIMEWNMGLSKQDLSKLKEVVALETAKDVQKESVK